MITLENDYLTVTVNQLGAEITSIIDCQTGYEFILQATDNDLNRQIPILFPIVEQVQNGEHINQKLPDEMMQYSFMSNAIYEVVASHQKHVVLKLSSSEILKEDEAPVFEFYIQYKLLRDQVITKFKVINKSDTHAFHYLLEGHPGLTIAHVKPSVVEESFHPFTSKLHSEGEITYFSMDKEGLVHSYDREQTIQESLELSPDNFNRNGLIIELEETKKLHIEDIANQVSIQLQTANLPYLRMWSTPSRNSNFILLEPLSSIKYIDRKKEANGENRGGTNLEPNQQMMHEYCIGLKKTKNSSY